MSARVGGRRVHVLRVDICTWQFGPLPFKQASASATIRHLAAVTHLRRSNSLFSPFLSLGFCGIPLCSLIAMADALCGPSNALQNFQKHTSVDRTLQQDRLIGRHSPAQVRWSVTQKESQTYID